MDGLLRDDRGWRRKFADLDFEMLVVTHDLSPLQSISKIIQKESRLKLTCTDRSIHTISSKSGPMSKGKPKSQ